MISKFTKYNEGIKRYLRVVGWGGLLSAIKGKAKNSSTLLKVDRQDCKYPIWLRIPSSDIPTYHQVFIDKEYEFLVNTQPKVIVDAGANIGLVSIYFANKYPESKIIAIEPEKSNFELLKKNVQLYSNIMPIQSALWDKNEDIYLIDPGKGNWGFITENKKLHEKTSFDNCETVSGVNIDKIMTDFKLKKIDILKIDIEGAETEVFSNTSSWIERVDSIIIELHEFMKKGCNRSFYVGSNGFDNEWIRGENVYLSRGNCIQKAHNYN